MGMMKWYRPEICYVLPFVSSMRIINNNEGVRGILLLENWIQHNKHKVLKRILPLRTKRNKKNQILFFVPPITIKIVTVVVLLFRTTTTTMIVLMRMMMIRIRIRTRVVGRIIIISGMRILFVYVA